MDRLTMHFSLGWDQAAQREADLSRHAMPISLEWDLAAQKKIETSTTTQRSDEHNSLSLSFYPSTPFRNKY